MNVLLHWLFCGCLLLSFVQARTGLGMQYHVRDTPLPDMTIPQPSAQVVSPAIYVQLGEQDKALQVAEARFAAIDQRFKDEDTSLEKLRDKLKPLEDANVEAHLIIKGISIFFSILVSTGLLAFIGNYFKEYLPVRNRTTNRVPLSAEPGIMPSVYADSGQISQDSQSLSDTAKGNK